MEMMPDTIARLEMLENVLESLSNDENAESEKAVLS